MLESLSINTMPIAAEMARFLKWPVVDHPPNGHLAIDLYKISAQKNIASSHRLHYTISTHLSLLKRSFLIS